MLSAKTVPKSENLEKPAFLTGGKGSIEFVQEVLTLLMNVALKLDIRIADIKKLYLVGMKNKMYEIQYGKQEKLKLKRLKDVFVLLGMKKPLNFKLLTELDNLGLGTSLMIV